MIDSSRPSSESAGWRAVADYAQAHESDWGRDPVADETSWGIHLADPPPWNRLLGPVFARGGPNGVVLREGKEIARWGDPTRADLTFSIAKTYLALLAGVAHDRGLLPDPDQRVGAQLPGIGFDDVHNMGVTWDHLLQQTSEWSGTCFDIPDQVDHHRRLSFEPAKPGEKVPAKGSRRELTAPGTTWEYNDVRINQLSLALAHLFGGALPDVFDEAICRPLGIDRNWHWHGYLNSWVTVGSKRVQSVPGGSHWGGGIRISACDQARIARLVLSDGEVDGKRILSKEWLARMRAPCRIAPFYGYLLWLNTGRRLFPAAPVTATFAIGAGSSIVAHLPEQAMVIVMRWIKADRVDGMIARVLEAIARDQ